MRSHFPVAVHLIIRQGDQILLLRRFNTGYEDGNYGLVAGHVDAGESVSQAAAREGLEEAGIRIDPEDVEVAHVTHRKSNDERFDFFVCIKAWEGEIRNREPDKCDDLSWFPLACPPVNLIAHVRLALENYQKGIFYSEYGWQSL